MSKRSTHAMAGQRRLHREPRLWPSTGEYPIYDELLYRVMSSDVKRVSLFRSAIDLHAAGRHVIDVGCGANLDWTIAAIEAGASSVVAIEQLERAYYAAQQKRQDLPPDAPVDVIRADALTVILDRKADVVVSETIGSIGGAEGAATLMSAARENLLKLDGVIIPHSPVTFAAAADINRLLGGVAPDLSLLASHYVQEIFNCVGGPFDLRFVISDPDVSGILSEAVAVERLNFNGDLRAETEVAAQSRILKDGCVDGLALWVELSVHPDLQVLTRWRITLVGGSPTFPYMMTRFELVPAIPLNLSSSRG